MSLEKAVKKWRPKELLIIRAAIKILGLEGDHGLTMRRLAMESEMSLSNVQYYFKDKSALLSALVIYYFDLCIKELADHLIGCESLDSQKRFSHLLGLLLAHGHEMTEMCRIFRELWAIAARNEKIAVLLAEYYQSYAEVFVEALVPEEDQEIKNTVKTFLIPYIEGYSITAPALGTDIETTVGMLHDMLRSYSQHA